MKRPLVKREGIASQAVSAVMALVLLGLGAATPIGAKDLLAAPELAGLQLGMTPLEVLKHYPEAEVSSETPRIHCYGRLLSAEQSQRAKIVWEGDGFWLSMKFHREHEALRLNTIEFRNPANFAPDDFDALQQTLVDQRGNYSRLLIPAKLDAARLLIGFEWAQNDVSLTYRIHYDTHGTGNDLYVTQRLTNWLSGSSVRAAADEQQRGIYRQLRQHCGLHDE